MTVKTYSSPTFRFNDSESDDDDDSADGNIELEKNDKDNDITLVKRLKVQDGLVTADGENNIIDADSTIAEVQHEPSPESPLTSSDSEKAAFSDKTTDSTTLKSKSPTLKSDGAQESADAAWRSCESVKELLELGGEALKQILLSMGLKCGGTVDMRAERLFSVRNLSKEDFPSNLFATSGKNRKRKAKEIIDR